MQEFRHLLAHMTTIGLIQMRCASQPDKNSSTALTRIADAAKRGAQIVCLPELFRSLYFCQTEDHDNFKLAEPIPGPTTDALGKAAGKYRKMHIPDDPLYYEKFYFTPGDLGFQTFKTKHANIGTLVCWDQWYPEGARLTALKGAQILFCPTAIGWHKREKKKYGAKQHDAWVTIQRAHAIANGCFVAAPNRVGVEGTVEFWGSSFVCDPFGEIIAQASHDNEQVLITKCDLSKVEETRQHWPFLRDRRIDAYAGITQRLIDE